MAIGVIRRKLALAQGETADGGPGADRGWRVALARAARDHLKLPLEVTALALSRAGLAELLELPPEQALIAVLEGPAEGLGVLVLSPEVLQAMIETLTLGQPGKPGVGAPRKPTRTDAAMVAPMMDAALTDLEQTLADEADLIWAGGWRYASFIDDPRPLGLMLEDISYRVLRAEVDLGHGARSGVVLMALPAEGRGALPKRAARPKTDEAQTRAAFAQALGEEVEAAECQLDAVLMRLSLPLSRVVGLAVGDVLPLGAAALDAISLEGLDGRKLAEGKLGQNRGLRALRLGAVGVAKQPRSAKAPPSINQALPQDAVQGLRQSA